MGSEELELIQLEQQTLLHRRLRAGLNISRRILPRPLICLLASAILLVQVAAQSRAPIYDLVILTLEEAIRKMTSWPATRLRLSSRGLIKEGGWADVVIFDYEKVQDRASYEQPLLHPVGIDYVLVNGQVVIDHGKHTGARPGKVLYGSGHHE